MSKIEGLIDTACGTGVLLAPLWLAYKFVLFIVS